MGSEQGPTIKERPSQNSYAAAVAGQKASVNCIHTSHVPFPTSFSPLLRLLPLPPSPFNVSLPPTVECHSVVKA